MPKLPDPSLGDRPTPKPSSSVASYSVPDTSVIGDITAQSGRELQQAGHTLNAAGNELYRALNREQRRVDGIASDAAFNTFEDKRNDLVMGPENGFINKRGADAVTGDLVKDWMQKFDDTARQTEDGLANQNQKGHLKKKIEVARNQFQASLLKHLHTETNTFQQQTNVATVDTAARDVGANPTDDATFAIAKARVEASVDAESKRLGLTPDMAANAKAKVADHLWTSRLNAYRLKDPAAALGVFQKNQDQISPDVRIKIAEGLYKDAAPVLAAQLNEVGGPPIPASMLAKAEPKAKLSSEEEQRFQEWYGQQAKKFGINPNPDDPNHFYDYRAAFKAGSGPDKTGHWPSQFKQEGNARTYVNPNDQSQGSATPVRGWLNTKTGETAKDMPRGIRNNNPGNIILGPSKWQGEIEGGDPKYASFATPEDGIRALGKNLLAYGQKGVDSVQSIITRWAPATENDTNRYIATVAKEIGVNPAEPLNLKDRKVLTALASAIIKHENGTNPYTQEQVAAGIEAAASGKETPPKAGFTPASLTNLTGADALKVVTGNPVVDALPGDQKINVLHLARTQANQGSAQAQHSMKVRLQDTTAAYEKGLDAPNPPSRTELIQAFGQFDGDRAADELATARQFGDDVRRLSAMPTTQQAALVAARQPKPGDGFANAERRHEQLSRAVDQVSKERQQDPSLSVLRSSPQVQAAYQSFIDVLGNQQATDVNRSAAAQAFASATLAEQQRLEIRNPQILSKDMVDSIAKRFAEPAKDGQGVASIMRGQVDQWGKYWPMVGAQLSKSIPPGAVVLGLGVKPEAEAILGEALKLKPEQINQGIPEPDIKDMKERVRNQFEPLRQTLAYQGGGVATYDNYADTAATLATALMQKGYKVKDAVEKAWESTVGFKYEFESTWRVPKDQIGGSTTVSSLRLGAESAKRDITSEKPILGEKTKLLVPSDARLSGVRPGDLEKQWRDTVQDNGFWVTSPGDGGLSLYVKSGLGAQPVLDQTGTPIRRNWSELSGIGNSVRAAHFADVKKRKP